MGRFFIGDIPPDAEFIAGHDFSKVYDTIPDASDEIMFLDQRLTLTQAKYMRSEQRHRDWFKIKDRISNGKPAEVLISLSFYKIDPVKSYSGKPFQIYLDGLKAWMAYTENADAEALRVYVADDCWDVLHKEGVFANKSVDFVRMASSCTHTYMGTLWRYLAFDDYNYRWVDIDETEGHVYDIDYGWKHHHPIQGQGIDIYRDMPDDVHICTSVLEVPQPPRKYQIQGGGTESSAKSKRLSLYLRIVTPHLTRCELNLPFKMRQLMAWEMSASNTVVAYLPSANLWTELPGEPNMRYANDGHSWWWASKITKMYLRLFPDYDTLSSWYQNYGDNWFYKRLYDDLRENGHTIVAYGADEKGSPFEL